MGWTLDLSDNSNGIKRQSLDDLAGEYPGFDERRTLDFHGNWRPAAK
jgi:hypothetical protein